mgnify:CR=1 FL=1
MIHRAHDFKMVEPKVFSRREVNRALLATALNLLSGGNSLSKGAVALPTPLFDFAIAGGFYHGLQAAQATLRPGMAVDLRREPDNPHDADAIAVHLPDGLMLGYVPRVANSAVARLLDAGRTVRGEIVRMLTAERDEDIPDDLVFTCFTSGDPMIRLTAEGSAA